MPMQIRALAVLPLLMLPGEIAVAQQTSPESDSDRPLFSLPYRPSLDLSAMDRSADPCVDFYAYSCGGWMKKNPIPPDQPAWSVYGKLTNENLRFLWGVLEQVGQASTRAPNQQKIGAWFASGIDESAADKLGAAPLK